MGAGPGSQWLQESWDLRTYMAMKPAVILSLLLSLRSLCALSAVAQEAPPVPQSPEVTIRVSSDLVLVPVIALNAKNGLPDKTLKRDDFQVFDDGHPVSIQTFDSSASTRPLALWFVVQCSMKNSDAQGSGLFRGRMSLFKPALKYLDKQDTVGVAHWCDNGDSQLDVLPTTNVEEPTTSLEQVLGPTVNPEDNDRTGELALQRTLQLMIEATHSSHLEPLPVVVFLYADHSGMPRSEVDHFIDELLETSAITYGLKDRRSGGISPFERWAMGRLGEQAEVADYIATQTGGQYFKVTPETYAKGLEEILQQLHFRYELGFKPEALDGKRHKLGVKLANGVKNQHKGVRLSHRSAYVPVAGNPR
jgi:hypothetical protein